MQEIYLRIGLTVLAIVIYIVKGLAIPSFLRSWQDRIKKFAKDTIEENEEVKKSKLQVELIEKRGKELGFITEAVSRLEIIVFGVLILLLLLEGKELLEIVKTIGAFLGGWLTLKVLSSHTPWSDFIVGKAYYHTSLFGTLFNVIAALAIGTLIYFAWFSY